MGKLADQYLAEAARLQREACEKNRATLEKLGPIIGKSLADGGILHTFGSGHSDIIAREIIGRAGGLVCISGIQDPTGGFIENLNGYGAVLGERYARFYGMKPGEVIIVISNSGKNASPIEVALEAQKRGLTVVAVTCMAMSRETPSQHSSGKKLYEIADYVLDNNGVSGDAIVPVPNSDVKAGPTSTLTGAILLNLLQMEVIEYLAENNLPLPLLRSQNLEGAMEKNQALAAEYNPRLTRPI